MNSEEEEIRRRLYDVIPAGTLHMQQLLRFFAIRFSETLTPSVTVYFEARPELIINKNFIEQYCKTDEHLFMAVMHELYHLILGHNALFKRITQIDNLAFDAIINAMLCREFPQQRYTSFFTQLYDAGSMPAAVLRPPSAETPEVAKQTMEMLYTTHTGTYQDVINLLVKKEPEASEKKTGIKNILSKFAGLKNLLKKSNGMKGLPASAPAEVMLLGSHDNGFDDVSENPMLKEMTENMTRGWPMPDELTNQDPGGNNPETLKIAQEKRERAEKMKMLRLLKRAGITRDDAASQQLSVSMRPVETTGFFPDFSDRSIAARIELQKHVLLYNRQTQSPALHRENLSVTYVYLDVSGSVMPYLSKFIPLLVKPAAEHQCEVFAFSTQVYPVSAECMKNGNVQTTGGTDINCVLEHFFSQPKKMRKRKILVLTDGFTGSPSRGNAMRVTSENVMIYCGLFGNSTKDHLCHIVKRFEVFSL